MPPLRVGIDFDNTLVDYDTAFPEVARAIGITTLARSKRALREELQGLPDGERLWQKVQGLTYGLHINKAVVQPGASEFVIRALTLGHTLYIVSHKTEFGHHDPTRTSLRDAALTWLLQAGLAGDRPHQIPTNCIHFAPTREEKIETIDRLELDLFIDDLQEVLEMPGFPPRTRRYWFADTAQSHHPPSVDGALTDRYTVVTSWRQIGVEILGEPHESQIKTVLEAAWPDHQVDTIARAEGRGNSRIYRVDVRGTSYALKVYADRREDPRPRREPEWAALELLGNANFAVPKPIATFPSLNWSILEWIDGKPADSNDSSALQIAANFVEGLITLSRSTRATIGSATEACLSPATIQEQIETRIKRLESVHNAPLSKFLRDELRPALERHVREAKHSLGASWNTEIPQELRILSPSDFGFHNCLVTHEGSHVFFDFEYFGWDDPVKLVSDFILHPGFEKTDTNCEWWIKEMRHRFAYDSLFDARLKACLPLYAIRWSLIILNEFLGDKSRSRIFAKANVEQELETVQQMQLEKARRMIRLHTNPPLGHDHGEPK